MFGSETSIVIELENDMDKLTLCCNWSYKLNKMAKDLKSHFLLKFRQTYSPEEYLSGKIGYLKNCQ